MGEPRLLTARWIIPVVGSPPIEGGAVAVRGGMVVDLGGRREMTLRHGDRVRDLGEAVLMPGLVNAHTHLELSALKGKVKGGNGFVEWVGEMMTRRIALIEEEVREAAALEAARMSAAGTALVGDVTNSGISYDILKESDLNAVIFHEVLGFDGNSAEGVMERCRERLVSLQDSPRVRNAVAPHAPYSVSPKLFRAVAAWAEKNDIVTSVHLAESETEVKFIKRGHGRLKGLLKLLGKWDDGWRPCPDGPVVYLDRLGFIGRNTLCVHLTQAAKSDVDLIRARGATACLCVRSNERIGVGRPPVGHMMSVGLPVALGTDSLASNDDLNVLAEARAFHERFPRVPREKLLEMITINGAGALGFGDRLGSMEAGKEAAFCSAAAERGSITDPYEFVFEGVDPERVVRV